MMHKDNVWEEFDKSVDIDGLQKDIKQAEENDGQNFKDVPLGEYEIKIEKLELVKSKKNDPMFSCWMKIINGEYKGSMIFMNQVMTQGFQIHIVDEFLRSLDSGIDIEFKTYSQFAKLLEEIKKAIDGVLEYAVEYGEKKGFNTFKITNIFEVEE